MNFTHLHQTVGERLRQASCSPRRLILLYSGVSFGAALLITLLSHLLYRQIDAHTGGLSGMQLRSVLQTAVTALQYIQWIFIPFWNIGLLCVTLRFARGQQVAPRDLLEGFRRFGPVLRLYLLEFLLYSAIAFVCAWAGSFLYILTPFALPLVEYLAPALTAQTPEQLEAVMAQLDNDRLLQIMMPAMIITGILCLIAMFPVGYRLRFSRYAVMDQPGTGALRAMLQSNRMMRGKLLPMLKLDLHFWLYYLLTALLAVLAYTDLLLPQLGIALPISDSAAQLIAGAVYAVGSVGLQLWLLPKVETTYAVTYQFLERGENHV